MFASLLGLALAAVPLPAGSFSLPKAAQVRPADPRAEQGFSLGLRVRDRAGLDALIAAQHDPASPAFRHWLSPAEFGDRFGVPAAVYEALAKQLERSGVHVTRYAGRTFLTAQGTVGEVQQALGVKLVDVAGVGETFRSFQGTPKLPEALAVWVQSVGGLDGRSRVRHRLTVRGTNTFGPQDLRRYYDIDLLHAAGYSGQLSKVAVVGTLPNSTNEPNPADVAWFYGNVSDSPAQFIPIHLPKGGSLLDTQQGLKIELEMDAELPTVAAPLMQSVTMILGPANDLFGTTYAEAVNNHADLTAVSASFGGCELLEDRFFPGEMDTVSNLVAQGVSEGIAFFSASGDDGTLACIQFQDAQTEDVPSIDFPSAIPYMTAVGGTMFTGTFNTAGAVQQYGQETTWNEFSQIAGGGGVSQHFARPSWQFGPGASDGGFREVPDLALLAATQPGVAIVARSPGQIDPDGNGTSDAAPLTMGIFAAINDRIGGCRLGTPNFELYALGRAQYQDGSVSVFHDIQTGDLSVQDTGGDVVQGPAAHVGYDEATGLGTPDVAALAEAWPPCALAPPEVDAGEVDAGEVDAGEVDAGEVDAGDVDAGALDAGAPDAGEPDAGPIVVLPWDGGFALDAGVRTAYAPCAALACDGGTLCVTPGEGTLDEGPSQCLLPCDLGSANCAPGSYCGQIGDGSFCVAGCGADSDCATGQVCNLCSNLCIAPGNPDAGVGSACTRRSQCQTAGFCLSENFSGLPDGYCSQQCSSACGCPDGSACEVESGFCFQTCALGGQGVCRDGYVCDPSDETGSPDLGVCLPNCNDIGGQCFGPDQTCDAASGLCLTSGQTGSTSGSSGSSGSGATSGSGTGSGTTGSTGKPDAGGCGCGTHGESGLGWVALLLGLCTRGLRRRD